MLLNHKHKQTCLEWYRGRQSAMFAASQDYPFDLGQFAKEINQILCDLESDGYRSQDVENLFIWTKMRYSEQVIFETHDIR